MRRRGLLEQQRRGADAQREEQDAAEPEGEGERRRAAEDVVRRRPSGRRRGKQSQAARTSRWKCIVPLPWPVVPEVKAIIAVSSAAVSQFSKVAGFPPSASSSESGSGPSKWTTRAAGHRIACSQSAATRAIGQREADLRLVGDVGQLAHAQQRHGGDRHAAGLEHGEPAGRHHRIVRAAQQHAVARHDAEIVHQNVSDPVRGLAGAGDRSRCRRRSGRRCGRRRPPRPAGRAAPRRR